MSGAAALSVCLQWCEMRSGSADTRDLAVAAKKQAGASVQQAGVMAAKQFTAFQRLIESQRAAITLAFANVLNPVTFHDGGLSFAFSITVRTMGVCQLTKSRSDLRLTSPNGETSSFLRRWSVNATSAINLTSREIRVHP
jgi:hypothetical protein